MTARLLPFRGRLVPASVYLETSFISYLAARPSRDPVNRARQEITRKWWEMHREAFELYVSNEVLDEIREGDPAAAQARLRYVASLPRLDANLQTDALAAEILRTGILPAKAAIDAAHIAIATIHKTEILLTWDSTHIANPVIQRHLGRLTRRFGYDLPALVTPEDVVFGG
jgi:predicted nucleic acid-binding protein